jgi:hypothetical protein
LAASISFCEMNPLGVNPKMPAHARSRADHDAVASRRTTTGADHLVESTGPRSKKAISWCAASVQSNTEMPP